MSQTQKTTTYSTSNEKFIQRTGDEVKAQKKPRNQMRTPENEVLGSTRKKGEDERKEF